MLISPFQNAFVHNRQIADVILIANELVDSDKKINKKGVIVKTDLEEAYDHVDWKILDYLHRKMSFGSKSRDCLSECTSLISFFVLMNGTPTSLFCSYIAKGCVTPSPSFYFLFLWIGLRVLFFEARN